MNPPPLDGTSTPRLTDAWRQPGLSEAVRVRVLRAVYGDPRAASEAVPRLTVRQAAGLDPLPTEPAQLAPAFLYAHRAEIRELPDDTRLLLLLAAADQYPVATHAFLRAVTAARLDIRPLEAAEAAGVAHAGAGGVVFRDAWTRIAAYETGSPADRRDVHRLLARVLHGDGETPRRSWHRGAGALGPSARLAAELGDAARTAEQTGRLTLARALAERAATLCPEPPEQTALSARAAEYAWQSGDSDRARRLTTAGGLTGALAPGAGGANGACPAAEGDEQCGPDHRPTTVAALSGVLALRAGNATDAFDTLLGEAGRERGGRATHLLARATEAAIYTGDVRRLRDAARAAERLGVAVPGTLGGLVAAFDGRYTDACELLEAAAGRCGPGGDPTLLIHAGIAALLLGDHTRAAGATLRAADSARARGTTVDVAQAMEFRAYADFWTGRPRAGEAAATDALWQAHATGQDNGACHLQAALAMFAALTGDADLCRERAATARSYALAHGLGLPAALAQWALAFLDLGSGRFAAAAARLRAQAGFGPGHGHRAIRHLATPHYVEAAVRTGDTRIARVAHADYHRWASTVGSADDLALSARCRALLAPGAEAVEHYRGALALHGRGTRDFERARTELLFGGALRRLRRLKEARDRLHSALAAFEYFGAPHYAAQARAELRALGAPADPAPATDDDPTARLTAQQLLVARMAAEGATNREIAARLALSPRTIDHHLRGVFARLGIRSRIELVRLLAQKA